MSAAKTALDSVYAYRFISLMSKPFTSWKAFELGLINDNGSVVRRPKTPEEKSAYTPFHATVRAIKRMTSTIPTVTGIASISSAYSAITSRYGLTEADHQLICKEFPLFEEMVAGDSGGDVKNIATGTTTGAITNVGPKVIKASKSKKRNRVIMKHEKSSKESS